MSDLAFVASLVHSLAWPAAIVAIVSMFRRPLTSVIGNGLRRVKVGSFEAEFEQAEAKVRLQLARSPEVRRAVTPDATSTDEDAADLLQLAGVSPRAAVLEAFTRIESELRDVLRGLVQEDTLHRKSATTLAVMAQNNGLISAATVDSVQGLAVMRNLVAHRDDDVTTEKAIDYVVLADAALFAIRSNSQRARRQP